MNGCSFEFLIQVLSWEVVMTWICVSDVEQVLNACLLVRASIGLFLNKGLLVALQWMVPKYLRRVFREMKRYCACSLWVWYFKLEQNSNSSLLSITMGANICHLSLNHLFEFFLIVLSEFSRKIFQSLLLPFDKVYYPGFSIVFYCYYLETCILIFDFVHLHSYLLHLLAA